MEQAALHSDVRETHICRYRQIGRSHPSIKSKRRESHHRQNNQQRILRVKEKTCLRSYYYSRMCLEDIKPHMYWLRRTGEGSCQRGHRPCRLPAHQYTRSTLSSSLDDK